jgi:hypothetical protein
MLPEALDVDVETSFEFVAVAKGPERFELMLIAWKEDIAYRVTPIAGYISIDEW